MADISGPFEISERARVECLRSYAILDTPRESVFDRFVYIAAQAFRTPIAMLNLVDVTRQWSKALVGPIAPEIARDHSFGSLTILSADPLVVEDASQDSRFEKNPFVAGPPYIRFYAGAPLIAPNGARIGCLCVIDRAPRSIMTKQARDLAQMAQEAMEAIDERRYSAAR